VDLLDFVFRLGVLFAIYGFLWGLLEIAYWMLTSGRSRSLAQAYLIKSIKYFFLADVTFLFCMNGDFEGLVEISQVVLAGLILLTYFVGKLQKNQNRQTFFKIAGRGLPGQNLIVFNLRLEIAVISVALAIFGLFWFFPQFSHNPISLWFYESIVNIEDTPVFGFIFKVIGFFFLLNLIFKMLNAFNFLLTGGKTGGGNGLPGNNTSSRKHDDHFDDYEEVN
jgi:hypothetical protein